MHELLGFMGKATPFFGKDGAHDAGMASSGSWFWRPGQMLHLTYAAFAVGIS